MRGKAAARRALSLGLAALLLASAGALLWRSLDRDGVSVTAVSLPGGPGRLYRTEGAAGEETVILTDHADGEGGHTHAVSLGGQSAAALLLRTPGDGADGLAVELARRGVAVLSVGQDAAAAASWDWLTQQGFARLSTLALLARDGRRDEALALTGELAGGGKEPAALILLGDAAALDAAAPSPGRNILFLTREEPPAESAEAFLGEPERKSGAIAGYFAEGTARAVIRPVSRRWDRTDTLLPVIDWLGSSLGHAVELPDDDLIAPLRGRYMWGAAVCAAASLGLAAAALLRRKGKPEDNPDGGGDP